MQALLIEPDENMANIFELNIVKELGYEVITRKYADEAIEFLKMLPDIEIVISKDVLEVELSDENDSEEKETDAANQIADFLQESGRSAKLYVVGTSFDRNYEFCHVLKENITPEDLIKALKGDKQNDGVEELTDGHVAVPINGLKYIKKSPCDIFINLKSKSDDIKLVKRFSTDDLILPNEVNPYIEKGVEKLYLRQEDFASYVAQSNNIFQDRLLGKNLDKVSKNEIRNLVLGQIKSVGVNEHSLELATTFLKDIDNKVSSKKELKSISDIFNSTMGYPFQRSYMCSLFCKLIADEFGWVDETTGTNLSIASIFADSSLESGKELAISSLEELEASDISQERKDAVNRHAAQSADDLSRIKNISPIIEKIVRQHHGNRTGESLKFNMDNALNPLLSVYIVSDNFSRLILSTSRQKINTAAYVKEINRSFPDKHIGLALEKLLYILNSNK